MTGTYTTTGADTSWASSPGDIVGRLQAIMAEMRAEKDRLGLVDCLVMLRGDAERVKRQVVPAPAGMPFGLDSLAGLPVHVVDGVMEGRLLVAELGMRGKRVGVVGAIAPEDSQLRTGAQLDSEAPK